MTDPRTLALQMFSSRTRDFEERREKEIAAVLEDHSRRGVLQSGMRHEAVYDINRKFLLELPLKIKLEIEKELIQKGLREAGEELKEVLQQDIRNYIRDFPSNDLLRAIDHDLRGLKPGDGLRGHFHQKARHDCENTRADYFTEVAILMPLSQADATMKEEEEPTSINTTEVQNHSETSLSTREEELPATVDPLRNLHPEIFAKCRKLYEDGAYSEAVEKSFKVVRDRLRKLTGYETGSAAFGRGHLHIGGAGTSRTTRNQRQARDD